MTNRALIVVDVQPTFCEGGELPVTGGDGVALAIADRIESTRDFYALIITTQDWHVDPGPHWADEPDFKTSWPKHGIAGTPGAALHPALLRVEDLIDFQLKKGATGAAYSGFQAESATGEPLDTLLQSGQIVAVDVCGIATDYCVRETVWDALAYGYRVRLLVDLSAGVDVTTTTETLAMLATRGADVVGVPR